MGEQALELKEYRTHVCATPDTRDFFAAGDSEDSAPVAAPAPVASPGTEEASPIIAELRAALEAERGVSAGLRANLEAERNVSAGLRGEIGKRDDALDEADGKLRTANEAHTRYVREAQETFDQRLSEGVRAAEAGIRVEAVRIIEAIAADNPALAEAADLFTVAFPAEASGEEIRQDQAVPAPEADAPAPSEDFFAGIPAPHLAPAPEAQPASAEDDWEQVIAAAAPSAPETRTDETAPEPMTQVLIPAPDLHSDAILDPSFFDTPAPLDPPAGESAEAPAPEEKQAEAPKPGLGLFGRKKEAQNA
ncbi:hypothetical protein [Paenarthrobacter sp. YJN-5]|uniref:hypothetical protein n=1 Tax=unclassified Paenarthrobacter TaxID=2634190 RepID=UPI001877AB4F|nr:hypothetical protein [Paenarthrobacter sp. YJN-5]QOT19501.1 hypothetical protein HMI59_22970 [Paenarthrobacter sp. YJN-5]